MRRRWLLLLILLLPWSLVNAVEVKESAPEVYTVQEGDTLWDIAGKFLEKPWQWLELWRTNTEIENPHLIYPGDVLRLLRGQQGEPQLALERAPEPDKKAIKLTPEKRIEVKPVPVSLVPWTAIRPFVENAHLMSEEDYEQLPHILGNYDGATHYIAGDALLSQKVQGSDQLQVVRRQNLLRSPDGEVLGLLVRHVAGAKLLSEDAGEQGLIRVQQSVREVTQGDKLLPLRELGDAEDVRLQPATNQRGVIIENLDQHGLMGKYDVVIVDLGASQVSPGTVLGVYLQGPDVIDGERPEYADRRSFVESSFDGGERIRQPGVKAGEMLIVKTFDKASYGLIVKAAKIIRPGAIVAQP